jgi:hypothetical protein
MSIKSYVHLVSLVAVAAMATSGTAMARSRCDGNGFEMSDGRWIASKYCQEEAATAVADRDEHSRYKVQRLHGEALSEFCRRGGRFDIRTQMLCLNHGD